MEQHRDPAPRQQQDPEPQGPRSVPTREARQARLGFPILVVLLVGLILATATWVVVEYLEDLQPAPVASDGSTPNLPAANAND